MATLSGNKIKDTYQSLIKLTDNGNLTTGAKQLTDGFGNNSPLYLSTTQIGIGVTPEATYDLHVYSNAKVGGNLTVTGDLTVEGTTTTIDTQTLTVEDPLIEVASNNTSTDAVDIGWYGKYAPSGTVLYAGLFRDTGDSKFKLFRNLEEQPTTTVNTSGTGYTVATLVADVEGTLTGIIASSTTATTQSTGDNSTKVATTAYVDSSIGNSTLAEVLVNGNTTGGTDISVSTGDAIVLANDSRIKWTSNDVYISGTTSGDNLSFVVGASELMNIAQTGGVTVSTDLTVDNELTVSGTGQSSFAGQVTIPATPSASTDAASKAYVDSQVGANNELSEVLANGNTTGGTDIEVNGDNINFADGSLARFGASNDLKLQHNGTNSFIDNETGALFIRQKADDSDIIFQSDDGSGGVIEYFRVDGGTEEVKFSKDGKFIDNVKAKFGAGSDLQIYHDGSNSYIKDTGTGNLLITSDGASVQINKGTTENMAEFITDGAVNLYYDSVKKFETTSAGVTVTGGLSTTNSITLSNPTDKYIRFIDTYGNWDIEVGDGANNFKIHSVSLNADYLTLEGGGQLNLGEYGSGSFTGTATYRLAVDSSGDVIEIPIGDGAVDGSGATGQVAFWTDTDTIDGENNLYWDSTNDRLGIGTSSPSHALDVTSAAYDQVQWTRTSGVSGYLYSDSAGAGIYSGASFSQAGIYLVPNTSMDFRVNGSQRMYINSSGNVGIGTTSPTADLSVGSTSTSSGDVHLRTTKTTFSMTPSNTDAGGIFLDVGWVSGGQGPFKFGIGGTERMRIDSSGNIGIGTDTIRQRLHQHVSDSGANYHAFTNSTTGTGAADGLVIGISADEDALIWNHENENILFGTNNTERMRIDSSGITTLTAEGYQLAIKDESSGNISEILTSNTAMGFFADRANAVAGTSMIFSIDNSTKMTIDSSGKVIISNSGATNIGILQLSSSVTSYFLRGGANYGYLSYHTGGYHRWFGSDGAEDMRITSGGSVGIGETSVDAKLHLTATSAGLINQKFESAGSAAWRIGIPASQTYFAFDNANDNLSAPKMVIDSSGNVIVGGTAVDTAGSFSIKNNGIVRGVLSSGTVGDTLINAISGVSNGFQITNDASNNQNYKFHSNGGNLSLIINSSGKVGIKESSPASDLVVRSDSAGGRGGEISIVNYATNTTGNEAALNFGLEDSTYDADNGNAQIKARVNNGSNAATDMIFSLWNGSAFGEKMRIHSNGRISIGSSTATANTLTLSGSATEMDITNTSTNGRSYRLESDSAGLFVIKDRTANADRIVLNSSGDVGIGLTNPDAKLEVTGGGSAYTFRGVYSGTSSSYAAGAFQLTGGSTSPSLIDFIYSTTYVGQIITTGSGVLYQSNSDYRLKENVVEMTGALDRINQLQPSRFNFIGHEETVDGFLAHELQEVVPQAVSGEKDGTREDGTPKYQGVDNSQIVPLLVGAIKELKAEIETLKAQINN